MVNDYINDTYKVRDTEPNEHGETIEAEAEVMVMGKKITLELTFTAAEWADQKGVEKFVKHEMKQIRKEWKERDG